MDVPLYNRNLTKLRRQRRQQPEHQKNIRFNEQNKNSARAPRFLYISLQSLYNYDMKWPNFKFTWEWERQGDKFYHLCKNLGAVPSLQLQTKFHSLSNRAPWNNREKKWKDAKSIFQRLFLGPRRYRIIRSLMNSKRQLQRKLGHVMKMTWSWF